MDLVQARFVLEFTSPCRLCPADLLGLGRSLRAAGRLLDATGDPDAARRRATLFEPPLSDDPVARRRFQKPAPAFVVTMPLSGEESFAAGDRLDLAVLFLGTGVPSIGDFLSCLVQLGRLGLSVDGAGRFEVMELHNRESADAEALTWRHAEPVDGLVCNVRCLGWLLQERSLTETVWMEFLTPARLLVDGRPLRRPRFDQLFPFMLRRVTSMLHAHAGVEPVDDPAGLLAASRAVDVIGTGLDWRDWRPLGPGGELALGGFVGSMTLSGPALEELFWILALAALFGIGKGATYGAGSVALRG